MTKVSQNKLFSYINSLSEKFSSPTTKIQDLFTQLLTLSSEIKSFKTRIPIIKVKLKSTNATPSK